MSVTYYNASGQVLAAAPNATPVEHSTTLAHLGQRRSGWRWTGTRFVRNRIAYAEVTTPHGTDRYAR